MNKSSREVEIEKDGIVHVIPVDKEGVPIDTKGIEKKIDKPKETYVWWKMGLILFLVIISSKIIVFSLSAETNYTPGVFPVLLESYLIYGVVESESYHFLKKLIFIPLIYISVEIGTFLVFRIFYWLLAVLVP
jgi:hypothetical protein